MPKKFASDKPSIAEIRKLRQKRRRSVWVPLDAELAHRIQELERDLREAKRLDAREHRTPQAPVIQAELDDLYGQADRAAVQFTFEELGRADFRALIAEHPDPTGKTRWNEDTFAPALIAACCVEPEMELEDAEAIWNEWAQSSVWPLFATAWELNEGKVEVPFFGRNTSETRGSPQSSTSASGTDTSDTTSS